jgi:hypothetical protein
MFVTLTRAKVSADEPLESAGIVAEELERWLTEIEGFEGFVMLSQPGTSIGLSFWKSREVAEHHRMARMQFIERMLSVAGVEVEEILDFDVTYARFSPGLFD